MFVSLQNSYGETLASPTLSGMVLGGVPLRGDWFAHSLTGCTGSSLCGLFGQAGRLSLTVGHGGLPSCGRHACLWNTGSGARRLSSCNVQASLLVAQGLRCAMVCGILKFPGSSVSKESACRCGIFAPEQGWNPYSLHEKVESRESPERWLG